jgi:protein phosphatase
LAFRIVDHAAATHTGRVRRLNEDSHLAAPPLFVVADGMGGARAGEVASRLCIEVFGELRAAGGEPEDLLRRTIEEANRRIHRQAAEDPAAAGMGTTVTAALVSDDAVSFGHVGDSRAYIHREGVFQQLSDDHSLVGELVRRGALSPADAEAHPQRSVITRALGTEAEIEVDTWSVEPRIGDIFLLATDGLTNMVSDDAIADILDVHAALADAAQQLVGAANRGGGEDNVTAVLFRVGDETTVVPPPAVLEEDTDPRGPPLHLEDADAPEPARPGRVRRALRRTMLTVVLLGVLAAVAVGALTALSWSHFVGAEPDGRVAVYQGVPVDIGWGVRLYRPVQVTSLPAALLTAEQRRQAFDHRLRSKDDAIAAAQALDGRTWTRAAQTPSDS